MLPCFGALIFYRTGQDRTRKKLSRAGQDAKNIEQDRTGPEKD
jgi:hypothetical protein